MPRLGTSVARVWRAWRCRGGGTMAWTLIEGQGSWEPREAGWAAVWSEDLGL